MALDFKEFKQSPSWYIMFLCLSAVGFMYTKGVYDEKSNRKEGLIREAECKADIKYYQSELAKANSKIDTLYKLVGYLNGINQNKIHKK